MLPLFVFCLFFCQVPIDNRYEVSAIKLEPNLLRGSSNESIQTETPAPKATKKRKSAKKPVDYSRLDVRVGKIISIQEIVTAQNLYVGEVDVGETISRTVVSALVDQVPMEELENKRVAVLCNIRPRRMRGYVSEGMLLCANTPNKVEVLDSPFGTTPGDRIIVEGYEGPPDKELNPKEKILETVLQDMKVNGEKVATYKGLPLHIKDKGVITTETLENADII